MHDVLMHVPEGNHNPYEPVPWCRYPLTPTSGERFRVGVRSSADVGSVIVEWKSGHDRGQAPLQPHGDDGWTGRIGPFAGECQYRFVVPGAPELTTRWFRAPITAWKRTRFASVAVDGGRLQVCGSRTQLSLVPGDGSSVRWSLTEPLNTSQGTDGAEIAGWTAQLEDGDVILSRNDARLVISVEAARQGGGVTAWRLAWTLDDEERIFGTGERFDTVNQRGKTPDVRVYEQYKRQSARTYFPVSWLASTRGYALAIDSPTRTRFDLGGANPDRATATVPSSTASGSWYFGTPKQTLQAYMSDIGLPSPMPMWAYGPWMSGNEWDSETRVREVVERTLREGVPATVLVIEAWSDETTFYLFNDTTHDPGPGAAPVPAAAMAHSGRWPDPKALVDWLHDHNIRVLLWQIPVLKDTEGHPQHDADIAHADQAGLCVATVDGGTYRNRGWWFPNSRIIDFTNPTARQWWFDKRRYLLDDIGIDGFKTDGGEHLWGHDVTTSDGATGDAAANTYPTQYLAAYHGFLRTHGHDRPVTFSRAGFTGSQSLPAHWAGDEDSTWAAYRASLTAGLSAGMSGIVFWGWDLAGFSGALPSAELYKRATAMAAFCPIMQYHSEHNEHREPLADRTPWNVAEHSSDDSVLDIYRFYARLRINLIPYLLSVGDQATRTGLPMMRTLALEYPDDPAVVDIDDQFLLGTDLLIAPILEPDTAARPVYLPEPGWSDLWTGEPAGQGWTTAAAPEHRIPVYLRAGGCIPLWLPDTIELGAPVGYPGSSDGHLVLLISPGAAHHTLVDPTTLQPCDTELTHNGTTLTISTTGAPAATAWILDTGQHKPIPAGDATTTIELTDAR